MNRFLVIVFSLLQMYLAQNSAIDLFASGSLKKASGVATVKAVGDKVSGEAATDVKPDHVSSIATASAVSKKKPYSHPKVHKPPPKKHTPPKKHVPHIPLPHIPIPHIGKKGWGH
eukprot:TRINITY_DN782_c0_g2_i1.p3 TRINITY_DN782_c0_g2~~TRINITY_DN782_c0_g2_i1.p3  ORF type:complete len:115 (-),score=21.10 TRINITY_DN782_c0_g2_i1:838-1182(-)